MECTRDPADLRIELAGFDYADKAVELYVGVHNPNPFPFCGRFALELYSRRFDTYALQQPLTTKTSTESAERLDLSAELGGDSSTDLDIWQRREPASRSFFDCTQ
jgi:hypothetical protein